MNTTTLQFLFSLVPVIPAKDKISYLQALDELVSTPMPVGKTRGRKKSKTSVKSRILDILSANGCMHVEALRKQLNLNNPKYVSVELCYLHKAGKIKNVSRGVWEVA